MLSMAVSEASSKLPTSRKTCMCGREQTAGWAAEQWLTRSNVTLKKRQAYHAMPRIPVFRLY